MHDTLEINKFLLYFLIGEGTVISFILQTQLLHKLVCINRKGPTKEKFP